MSTPWYRRNRWRILSVFCAACAWITAAVTPFATVSVPANNMTFIKPIPRHAILVLSAVSFFTAIIITAHFFATPQYMWTQNTISDLAAQGSPHGWIMGSGFIGFGLILNLAFLIKLRTNQALSWADGMIMAYGLFIMLTGFFSTSPLDALVPFRKSEADLHSLFATLAGFFLTGSLLLYLLAAASRSERGFHLLFLFLIISISALFGLADNGSTLLEKGVIQRLLYTVSFIWMIGSQWLNFKRQVPAS